MRPATLLSTLLLVLPRAGDSLTALQRLWAYITLGATGIVTEEAAPLVGGLMAHDGHLRLAAVGLWIMAGTWVADILLYYLGRWRGDWVKNRWPKLREFMLRVLTVVRRHPWRCSLAVRWAYGLRLTLPLACGAARVPFWLYAIGAAISAATWAFAFTLIGWGFGEAALRIMGHVRRYEVRIALGIVVAVVIAFYFMRKRHVGDEVVDALERERRGRRG
ncbi:MAG TPA: DedA family protein [Gemmatimonadaceae bacterium]|nr:DedA family protein [Gemmatimonadaceae bacterium]